jgi:hypothetical protein
VLMRHNYKGIRDVALLEGGPFDDINSIPIWDAVMFAGPLAYESKVSGSAESPEATPNAMGGPGCPRKVIPAGRSRGQLSCAAHGNYAISRPEASNRPSR